MTPEPLSRRRWLRCAAAGVMAAHGVSDAHGGAHGGAHGAAPGVDEARELAASKGVQLLHPSLAALPPIPLVAMDGQPRLLDVELATDTPLLLNFVFTSCSSSCSVQTAVLAQVQRMLVSGGRALRLASISIDPDNDTPEQLRRYAAGFGITNGWQFYTGRYQEVLKVQKLFDVYRGSKAAHPPVLFMRKHSHAAWLRVEGFPAAAEVVRLVDALQTRG
jgi:protein SCO1